VQNLKISLITVTRNSAKTLSRCIESVKNQNYNNIEYIIIDGQSTDETQQLINQYQSCINIFISEPDRGIYDAMNKGIKLATGNIIGILNSDDFFAYNDIISCVAEVFTQKSADVLYGDLEYINPKGAVVRKWCSKDYINNMFNHGWMPPHPTFYCKKALFERFGYYELQYGTAADYELMLRFMHLNTLNTHYLNKIMVKMTTGGVSNRTYNNRLNAWIFDFKAMRKNGVKYPLLCIFLKPLRKVIQYL
jgi:glycosyltransferase involved in cell wall biosynthesis